MKKYFYFFFLFLAFTPMSVLSGNVNPGKALEIAKKFMSDKTFTFDQQVMDEQATERGFYAFNAAEGGFVVVSADDRAYRSVIAYSTDGAFDYEQLPENARAYFDGLTAQMKALTDADASVYQGDRVKSASAIVPLIKTMWDQGAPYNNLCPQISSERCVTGCVATAMAQILYYWKWPNKGNGVSTYVWNGQTLTRDLSKSTYNYSSMSTTYSYSSTGAGADAVAVLMRDCGNAVSMNYGLGRDGGSGAYVYPEVLYYDFGYKMGTLLERDNAGLSNSEWDATIVAELTAGRPVLYAGHGTGGHQFIIDGYNGAGLFHFNFGWSGGGDGFYGTTTVNPGSYNFNYYQEMIIGLEPDKSWKPASVIPALHVRYSGFYNSSNVFSTSDAMTLKVNETNKIVAGVYPNTATNKAIEWKVFDYDGYSGVASISDDGTVKGLNNGKAVVAARPKGSSGSWWLQCEVTVSGTAVDVTGLKLNKTTLALDVNKSQKLTATITPSNATNKSVTWKSSNTSVATVDDNGTVKGIKAGKAVITCTSVSNTAVKATCDVTVSKVVVPVKTLKLNKTSLTMMDTDPAQTLTVTILPEDAPKTVEWSSNNEDIATVSKTGVVTPRGIGSATITCTSTATPAKKATCKVTVKTTKTLVTSVKLDQTSMTIKDNGVAAKLNATVGPDGAYNKTVKWESSNPAVATVDKNGNVKGVSIGTATITCLSAWVPAKKATCKVTVIDKSKVIAVTSVKLSQTTLTVKETFSETLTATVAPEAADNKDVQWTISDPTVAKITASGKTLTVKGLKIGTATITCTSKSNPAKKATCRLTVKDWRVPVTSVKLNKTSATVTDDNQSLTLQAIVGPEDATDKRVVWTTNCPVATISTKGSDQGQATIKFGAPGTWTVTCTSVNATSKKATCRVTWKSAKKAVTNVKLPKTTMTISDDGTANTLEATVTAPADAGNTNVIWTCSDESVVKITKISGKTITFKGLKRGTATITCMSAWTPSKKATCKVTVKSNKKDVTSVKLNKTVLTLVLNETFTLVPTIQPTDAYNKSVVWTSSNTAVATVSSTGVVKGISKGSAVITCQSLFTPTKKATCRITVKNSLTDDDPDEARTRGIDDADSPFAEGTEEAVKAFDVYNMQGRKVASQVTTLDGLPKGIYIINGKKVIKH